jgi:hypothetical protein
MIRTPDDHAALYNTMKWRRKLDWMINGHITDPAEIRVHPQNEIGRDACWYEFSPDLPDLHIVRTLDPDLIPLTFGYDSDPAGRDDVRAILQVAGHPEEQPLEPHAFA